MNIKELWRKNIRKITQMSTAPKRTWRDAQMIKRLRKRISGFAQGAELLQFVDDMNIKIKTDYQMNAQGRFYAKLKSFSGGRPVFRDGLILLNPNGLLNEDELIATLFHEIQHIAQYYGGLGEYPAEPDNIRHAVWWGCALEADADSFAVEMCWRMKQAGDSGPWSAVSLSKCRMAMAKAFEGAVLYDSAAMDMGYARRVAFDAWYLSDYNYSYYTADTLEEQYPRFVSRLEKYKDYYTPERRDFTAEDIQKLGQLSKVNYLALPGRKLDDALYKRALNPYYEGVAETLNWERYRKDRAERKKQKNQIPEHKSSRPKPKM